MMKSLDVRVIETGFDEADLLEPYSKWIKHHDSNYDDAETKELYLRAMLSKLNGNELNKALRSDCSREVLFAYLMLVLKRDSSFVDTLIGNQEAKIPRLFIDELSSYSSSSVTRIGELRKLSRFCVGLIESKT